MVGFVNPTWRRKGEQPLYYSLLWLLNNTILKTFPVVNQRGKWGPSVLLFRLQFTSGDTKQTAPSQTCVSERQHIVRFQTLRLAPPHTERPKAADQHQKGAGRKEGSHLGSTSQECLGFTGPLPLHRERVKISWHHLVSSHSVRWRSSGNYTHLHVLIWLISRNKHFPMTQATWWATHLQKLW